MGECSVPKNVLEGGFSLILKDRGSRRTSFQSSRLVCQSTYKMSPSYYAHPYDSSAEGFYFSCWEEYEVKAENNCNNLGLPVEEYEIQYIDGDLPKLFASLEISQATLCLWFDHFEHLDEIEGAACLYLSDYCGFTADKIASIDINEIALFEGTVVEYAQQHLDDTGALSGLAESLHYYFDVESFARDLLISRDIAEIQSENGTNYIIANPF